MKFRFTLFILISIILLAACSQSNDNNIRENNSSDATNTPVENIPTNSQNEEAIINDSQEEEDDGCLITNLTAEENLHCGTHIYSVHKYVESGLCTFSNGETIEDTPSIELVFHVNKDGFFDLGSSGLQDFIDERTGPNKYEVVVYKSDGDYYGTLYYEFSLTGFVKEEHNEVNNCVLIREYTLIE